MDCGQSFEEANEPRLGNTDSLCDLARVGEIVVFDSTVSLQCRCLTYWSGGYDERDAG